MQEYTLYQNLIHFSRGGRQEGSTLRELQWKQLLLLQKLLFLKDEPSIGECFRKEESKRKPHDQYY